jgi:hypothetical protein
MSVATKVTRCDDERIPRKVKVQDSDGGEKVYVQGAKARKPDMTKPGAFHLVYDEFHIDTIGLNETDGKPVLQQAGKGLPDKAIMSVCLQPPVPVAVGWEPYVYFYFEKE